MRKLMVVLLLGMGMPIGVVQAAPRCQFLLGFAAIHQLIPATVGHCVDDQSFATNGDAVQHTTEGELVWRHRDNWTAFTDGYHTWVNGPYGLQERLNSQRFVWEAHPEGLPTTTINSSQSASTEIHQSVSSGPSSEGSIRSTVVCNGTTFSYSAQGSGTLTHTATYRCS